MSNIGMMDGAFFVGRKDLVDWINGTLEVSIGKVEDTAFGAIACQLLDIMYPGVVAMHKVDWTAKQSFEYVANYKILQAAFIKAGVEKHIDVDRLIKGRYQDNLEFMQWFKRFFEMQVQDKGDYDCEGQRAKGKGGATYIFGANGKGAGKPSGVRPVARTPAVVARPAKAAESVHSEPVKATAPVSSKPEPSAQTQMPSAEVSAMAKELETHKLKCDELSRELAESKVEAEDLSKERDFYFDKLREVEIALQELVDAGHTSEVTDQIFKILYATAEGFEVQAESEPSQDAHDN